MKMATENLGKINGFDFLNMEAQKYWSMPSSYDMNKKKDTVNNIIYSMSMWHQKRETATGSLL